ncbi:MAG: hypothetical protein Ct9H300mP3_09130 [Gammaproteobacteria bacterium]|nr:MAG: hypothetical protein Ct9H300mP3_09130 [Gammaproteobacteria bacterium]
MDEEKGSSNNWGAKRIGASIASIFPAKGFYVVYTLTVQLKRQSN